MKYIDADRLRLEIERRLNESVELKGMAKIVCPAAYTIHEAAEVAYRGLLLFVDSLQQEPEVDLEKEIDSEWKKCNPIDEGMGLESAYMHIEAFDIIARHFFELGQRDAANKFDEIEYNRQRAEEEMSDKTLDEAADNFVWEVMENDEEGISDLCRKLRPSSKISDFYDALGEFFKAGAKWMAGQGVTLKVTNDTTWGEVNDFIHRNCDGVKEIQIRKKEENK